MLKRFLLRLFALFVIVASLLAGAQPSLDASWQNPPNKARLRAYWWWLNRNNTKASIAHDMETSCKISCKIQTWLKPLTEWLKEIVWWRLRLAV